MKFLRFITDIFNVSVRANAIKADEEKRAKSVRFAVTCIIYSVISALLAAIGSFLIFTLEASGLLYVFVLVVGVLLLAGTLVTFVGALVRLVAQFSLNRRAMSWIALIAFIACIGSSIAAVIVFLN